MAESSRANFTPLHVLFMMYAMVIVSLFVLMIFRDPVSLQADIQTEMDHTVEYLSQSEYQLLDDKTKARYQSWMFDSGVYPTLYDALAPDEQRDYAKRMQEGASLGVLKDSRLFTILKNFKLYFYQITHRITLMEFWLATLLPMLIAVIATGYYKWRIKAYQLTGQSTAGVWIWLKVLWLMLFLFLAYAITPNLFGAYSIFAPPTLLLVVALSISYVISSFSKSL